MVPDSKFKWWNTHRMASLDEGNGNQSRTMVIFPQTTMINPFQGFCHHLWGFKFYYNYHHHRHKDLPMMIIYHHHGFTIIMELAIGKSSWELAIGKSSMVKPKPWWFTNCQFPSSPWFLVGSPWAFPRAMGFRRNVGKTCHLHHPLVITIFIGGI